MLLLNEGSAARVANGRFRIPYPHTIMRLKHAEQVLVYSLGNSISCDGHTQHEVRGIMAAVKRKRAAMRGQPRLLYALAASLTVSMCGLRALVGSFLVPHCPCGPSLLLAASHTTTSRSRSVCLQSMGWVEAGTVLGE